MVAPGWSSLPSMLDVRPRKHSPTPPQRLAASSSSLQLRFQLGRQSLLMTCSTCPIYPDTRACITNWAHDDKGRIDLDEHPWLATGQAAPLLLASTLDGESQLDFHRFWIVLLQPFTGLLARHHGTAVAAPLSL